MKPGTRLVFIGEGPLKYHIATAIDKISFMEDALWVKFDDVEPAALVKKELFKEFDGWVGTIFLPYLPITKTPTLEDGDMICKYYE